MSLLAGFGLWQFGRIGLGGGEYSEQERDEDRSEWSSESATGNRVSAANASDVLARYGGRILEVEREHEHGREIFEIKLVDGDGRKRKVLVDELDAS